MSSYCKVGPDLNNQAAVRAQQAEVASMVSTEPPACVGTISQFQMRAPNHM